MMTTHKPPRVATPQDVQRAVQRSRDVLAYQHSSEVERAIILAWAVVWVATQLRPDGWPESLTAPWIKANHRQKFFITVAQANAMDLRINPDGGPLIAFIGCNQKAEVVEKLAEIWGGLGCPEGDGLGDAYQALIHN
jgi:hypothetical protein